MAYPGDQELSIEAQNRVLAAFRQVVARLQEGQRDDALIGLEFVLRMDPCFAPAINLQHQLAAGSAEVDLGALIDGLASPSSGDTEILLVEAVDDFNARNFVDAREKVERVLLDLPGHGEARRLLAQVDEALKIQAQVGQYLSQSREALDRGEPEEAANFVMMAQALDPHHPGISQTLREIESGVADGGAVVSQDPPTGNGGAYETAAIPVPDFAAAFEEAPPDAEPPRAEMPAETPAVAPGDEEELPADAFAAVGFDDDASDLWQAEPVADFDFAAEPGSSDSGGDAEYDFGSAPADGELGSAGGPAEPDFAAPSDDFDFASAPVSEESEGFSASSPAAELGDAPATELGFDVDSAEDGGLFDASGGDISDLFDTGPGFDEPDAADAGHADTGRIEELLAQGDAEAERKDFQAAVDIWSRIYLVDPSNEEAAGRIEEARRRLAEMERELEQTLYEAQDAAGGGDSARAAELLDSILTRQPNHAEALSLRERLSAAGAQTDGSMPLPDLEEDLFGDAVETPAAPFDDVAAPTRPAEPAARRPRSGLPWPMIAIGAAGLVVILVGVFFGSRFLSSDSEDDQLLAVNRVLAQAEELFSQGQVDEAIHLLQEYPATGLDQSRIARRLAVYKESQAPPTPTAVPQSLTTAERLLGQRRLYAAYSEVSTALKDRPQDTALLEIKQEILKMEPLVASLYSAVTSGDYRSAVPIARDLVQRHGSSQDFREIYQRSLFNAAITELRTFNLTAAEAHLTELTDAQPEDEDVERILKLVREYKSRPVDMRLKIFIRSLSPR